MEIDYTNIDITLIELAYLYLVKRRKPFTIVDIFYSAEKILQWSEQTNRFERKPKLNFKNHCLIVKKNYLE